MATFMTPEGERVEAFDAMADLYRQRGWIEGEPTEDGITVSVPPKRSASRAAWAAYAESLGYEVEDMTRASIIAAFDSLDT